MSFLDRVESDPRWASVALGPRETFRALVKLADYRAEYLCMGCFNRRDVAQTRGCSDRMISRDLRALRAAGILVTERTTEPDSFRPMLGFYLHAWPGTSITVWEFGEEPHG